jgi:uncharacterized protein with gpF-like domain
MNREAAVIAKAVAAGKPWKDIPSADAWTSLLFREIWKDTYTSAAQRTWDAGLEAARKDFDPDLWASWIELVLRTLKGEAAKRVASIIGTTLAVIQAIIDAAAAEGLSVRDLSKRIREAAPEVNRYRADRIARTEVHAALNAGTMQSTRDMLKETGLTGQKIWIPTPDERTRASHRDVQPVGTEEKFDVGGELLDFPGDPAGSPGNIINCRCAVGFKLEEPDWMR